MTTTGFKRPGLGPVAMVSIAAGIVLVTACVVFVFYPVLKFSRQTPELIGKDRTQIESALGAPTWEWPPDGFSCARGFPCSGKSSGGPVLMYKHMDRAWYMFFDANNRLVRVEQSRS